MGRYWSRHPLERVTEIEPAYSASKVGSFQEGVPAKYLIKHHLVSPCLLSLDEWALSGR